MPRPTLPLGDARAKLSRLWFVCSGITFVLVVAQSVGTAFQGQLQELWGWLLPTLLPTLSLILTVIGATAVFEAPATEEKKVLVRKDFYALTYWLSVLYFSLILFTILIQPAARYWADEKAKPVEVLKVSNLWLTPVQSLVIAATGTLFFTKQQADSGRG